MKVCIPVEENKGLDSIAYEHFGSSPFFLIVDSETKSVKAIQNNNLNHTHGMCQPLKAISGEEIDVVLAGGIGAGALMKLNNEGIKVYKVMHETALKNVQLLQEKSLREFTVKDSCSSHGCDHH